ncbi:hypothetical protein ES708_30735 [subsurface metagenome]
MTADKAIEYIDIVLKAHPRLRPGDFGQAVKLGQEALKRLQFMRQNLFPFTQPLLPGEDSIIDTHRSEHHIKRILESPPGRESGQ